MPQHEPPARTRFDTIDLLRGLSILAVVCTHLELRLAHRGFSIEPYVPQLIFETLFQNGPLGVTVFFSISGFLITFTSLRRFGGLSNLNPRVFYRIRFARIAPLLLALLPVLSVLHLAHVPAFTIAPEQATLPRALLAALTFHMNWLVAARGFLPAPWSILWSLSVEEMFYLFFPCACLLLLWRRGGAILFATLLTGFVVIAPFARTIWTTNEMWSRWSYLSCMDSIALGCLAALLTSWLQSHPQPWITRRVGWLFSLEVLGAGLAALIVLDLPSRWTALVRDAGQDSTVLSLGVCLIMVPSVLLGRPGHWLLEPLRWVGRHSYELYLTHQFVVIAAAAVIFALGKGPIPGWFALVLVASAAVAAAVQRLFSEPLNQRLRPHFAPKQPENNQLQPTID